jgi:hypothetical protein
MAIVKARTRVNSQSKTSASENPPKPQVKDQADLVKQRDLPEEKLKQIRAQSKNRDEGVDTTKVVKTSTGNPEAAAQKAAEQTSKNQSTAPVSKLQRMKTALAHQKIWPIKVKKLSQQQIKVHNKSSNPTNSKYVTTSHQSD